MGTPGTSAAPWWTPSAGGDSINVAVRVNPGARRSEIVGVVDGALRVKLAARPVDGQANAELARVIAAAFGVRRSAVDLLRGDRSRSKIVRIAGIDAPPDGPFRSLAEEP